MPMRRRIVSQDRFFDWLQRSSMTASDSTHSCPYHPSTVDPSIHLTTISLRKQRCCWLLTFIVLLLYSDSVTESNTRYRKIEWLSPGKFFADRNLSSLVSLQWNNNQRVQKPRSDNIPWTEFIHIALSSSMANSLSIEFRQTTTDSTDKSQNVNNYATDRTTLTSGANMAVLALLTIERKK